MKTDLVLTMDEYVNKTCFVPKRISPPARTARHIPISAEDHWRSDKGSHTSRCDRWGHPCPGSFERKPQTGADHPKIFVSEKSGKQKWNI